FLFRIVSDPLYPHTYIYIKSTYIYPHFLLLLLTPTLPPPSSTLFPYTTLFRSVLLAIEPHTPTKLFVANPVAIARPAQTIVKRTDRKSTRLNCSHVSNSYAAFCLKKKKVTYMPMYHPITPRTQ